MFTHTAPTERSTLSLHDALPIYATPHSTRPAASRSGSWRSRPAWCCGASSRSEEHTSELQSRQYLVCRLLLEKKKHDSQYETSIRHVDCCGALNQYSLVAFQH